MRQTISLGFFTPYKVGLDNIEVSLLQFVDDAILIGDCSDQNIWVMKSILKLFELSYELKINFAKCNLRGLNVDDALMMKISSYLRCKVSSESFSYLGIPVGDDLVRRVGNGSNTGFWSDKWLCNDSLLSRYKHLYHSTLNINKYDSCEWKYDKSTVYSVNSSYKALTRHVSQQNLFTKHSSVLWKSNAPMKVFSFAWRLFQDNIPTKIALLQRGVPLNNGGGSLCVFCNDFPESANHIFSSCKLSYSVWELLYKWLNISVVMPLSPIHHLTHHLGMMNNMKRW
ncbi:hypothetical protein Lal_00018216 [Lupinus albus]|nr:hypothetical protein Lal_00018216 [Lupinus albus]